jgi:large subunit ribosomal protein L22
MKAYLKNFRMSPRKVRLVTDAVKGKNVSTALVELSFMPKKAARTISKLIRSAATNAVNNTGAKMEDLKLENVEVNQGVTLKRHRARARGSAFPINKRCSNVTVSLKVKDAAKAKVETTKEAKTEK